MSKPTFDDNIYLDQMLALHGIEIDQTWREGIVANLAALRRAGDLVMTMDLDEAIESAPVYQASTE